MEPSPLANLAFSALAEHTLAGLGPPTLAPLPAEHAEQLLGVLSARLLPAAAAGGCVPPLPLLRLFYGGRLGRLRQASATDAWADEALGSGGLRGLCSLELPNLRMSPHGVAHLRVALGSSLVELTIDGCRSLGASGLAQACGCALLHTLRVTECGLVLDGEGDAEPLLSLSALTQLDLGGNPLCTAAALAICSDRSGRPLRTLRLWESLADDGCAMAAMELGGTLRALDLAWTRVGAEGCQCLAFGLGESLRELRLGHTGLEGGTIAAVLPLLSGLRALSMAGNDFDADDAAAAAALPKLAFLDLSSCRLLRTSAAPKRPPTPGESITAALRHAPSLRELLLSHATEDITPSGMNVFDRYDTRPWWLLDVKRMYSMLVANAHVRHFAPWMGFGDYGVGITPIFEPRVIVSLDLSSVANLHVLIASLAADIGGAPAQPEASTPSDLPTEPPVASQADAATVASSSPSPATSPRMPALRTFIATMCHANETALGPTESLTDESVRMMLAMAPRLTELDLSHNDALTDACVVALKAQRGGERSRAPAEAPQLTIHGLRGSLEVLRLVGNTGITEHSLPSLNSLKRLRVLDLAGTSVGARAAEGLLPMRRVATAEAHATAALGRLRHAEEARQQQVQQQAAADSGDGMGDGSGSGTLRQYDAATFLRLRASPYAMLPTRPLPSLPGVVLPAESAVPID